MTFPKAYVCNETKWPDYKVKADHVIDITQFHTALLRAMEGKPVGKFENVTFKITIPPCLVSGTLKETEAKWIKKFFYRLNVYFSEPTIESHKQVISLSLTDLLSSVGGVLGLWVGISAITVVEMLVLVGKLCKPRASTSVQPIKVHGQKIVNM